jgi:hypothetical protein
MVPVDAVVFHHDLLGADNPKSFVSVRIPPGGTPLNKCGLPFSVFLPLPAQPVDSFPGDGGGYRMAAWELSIGDVVAARS